MSCDPLVTSKWFFSTVNSFMPSNLWSCFVTSSERAELFHILNKFGSTHVLWPPLVTKAILERYTSGIANGSYAHVRMSNTHCTHDTGTTNTHRTRDHEATFAVLDPSHTHRTRDHVATSARACAWPTSTYDQGTTRTGDGHVTRGTWFKP